MPSSIFLVAGQSNAELLAKTAAQLNLGSTEPEMPRHAPGVYANGAPLTYGLGQLDWYAPGELAARLIAQLRTALLADPDARLSGILWVQGEADTHTIGRPNEYGARLGALVDRIAVGLADLGPRAADFRFVVVALSEDAPIAARRPSWQMVRDQQLTLDHSRITVVDPDAIEVHSSSESMFMADGLHYQPNFRAKLLNSMTEALPRFLDGSSEADKLMGKRGDDIIRGNGGTDKLYGSDGDDMISGGSGFDFLWGGNGDDELLGGTGNDFIYGGNGNDRLVGGSNSDRLWGGGGADVFVFLTDGPTTMNAGQHDVVYDFSRGSDRIDLSAIDANLLTLRDDAFRFIGAAHFTDSAGEIRFERIGTGVILIGDRNSDGIGDLFIRLNSTTSIQENDLTL